MKKKPAKQQAYNFLYNINFNINIKIYGLFSKHVFIVKNTYKKYN